MISLPMARSVILYQSNEFALFTFMVPIRVPRLWWLWFQKMEGNSATLFSDVTAEFPAGRGSQGAMCPVCSILCLSISLKQAVSAEKQSRFLSLTQSRNRNTIWPLCHFQKSSLPRDQVPAAAVFALCFI